jgi:uncharacterized lipoprotein YbaY
VGEASVSGEIHLEPPPADLSGATVRVRLEDTSLIDAAAEMVSEQVIEGLPSQLPAEEGIPFCLSVEAPDPKATYTVRVHVDLDGSGRLKKGDYINMESYPVLTRGHPREVTVRARRIG